MSRNKNLQPWQRRQKRGRLVDRLAPRPLYLIVTNGDTEATYFRHYRTPTGPKIVTVKKSIHHSALVDRAIEERSKLIDQGKYDSDLDETWLVIDRDFNPANKRDGQSFNEALKQAKSKRVRVAFSNDAFELWFVLHFQDLTRHTSRVDLNKLLTKHLGRPYHKGSREDLYPFLVGDREKALDRAAALYRKAGAAAGNINPATAVHLLVEKLINDPGFREM